MAQDAEVARLGGQGALWKRLTKKNGELGVECVFAASDGSLFALVVESKGHGSVFAVGLTEQSLGLMPNKKSIIKKKEEQKKPSIFWPSLARPEYAKKAKFVVEAFLSDGETDMGDLADMDEWEATEDLDPCALANQYVFAIIMGNPWNGPMTPVAMISQLKIYLEKGYCHDQQSPIERILPAKSDDSNGCGTWLIPGFDDPVELAFELLTRGFIWREDFQKLWDKNVEKGQKTGTEIMSPILDGRKLEESTPKMPGVGGPRA